jgi:hypothetical protein
VLHDGVGATEQFLEKRDRSSHARMTHDSEGVPYMLNAINISHVFTRMVCS